MRSSSSLSDASIGWGAIGTGRHPTGCATGPRPATRAGGRRPRRSRSISARTAAGRAHRRRPRRPAAPSRAVLPGRRSGPRARRPGPRVAGRDEHAAGVGDDLGGPAHPGADDRQAGVERLDERDPERLGAGVRLAMDVGRREQRGARRPAGRGTGPGRRSPGRRAAARKLVEVGLLVRPLDPARDPGRPARLVLEPAQRRRARASAPSTSRAGRP